MRLRNSIALLAVIAAATPAAVFAETADGITPYGQIRAYSGWVNQSKEVTNVYDATGSNLTTEGKKNTDYASKLTTTRLGVKAKYGEIDGVLEIGLKNAADSNLVFTRKAYAVWNQSESLSVKIGQDDAPYTFYGNSATFDNLFNGFGDTAQTRDYQIKVTYSGLYLDLLNPLSPASITVGSGTTASSIAAKNWDISYPKISAGYDYKNSDGSIFAGLGGVFQSQKVNGEGAAALNSINGKTLNAALAYAHASLKFGGLSVLANAGYGINTAVLGLGYAGSAVAASTSGATTTFTAAPELNSTGTGFKNTTVTEGYLEIGYDLGFLLVRGGAGYAQEKNSNWKKTDAQIQYFAQTVIPVIAKRFNIVPEVAYFDFLKDKNGNKQGHEIAAGAFFQFIL